MELLQQSGPASVRALSFWRNPIRWLREKNLSRGFWLFFSVAFFFDAGFSVYVFLFNLYLVDVHHLTLAAAAPVIIFVAPGPIDVVQANVAKRFRCLAKAAARWTIPCSFWGR